MANTIAKCVSNAYDALKRASFEVVRAVRRQQRRRARNVVRPSSFRLVGFKSTPPVCRVETAPSFLELLGKRKRGAEEEANMVTHKKARFATSPWANEKWAQYGNGRALTPSKAVSAELKAIHNRSMLFPPGQYEPTPYRVILAKRLREERKSKPRKGRNKFTTFPPRYEPYRASDRKPRKSPSIHLTRSPTSQFEFWDSDIEQTPSPEKKPASKESSNAEMAAKESNIIPLQIPISPSQIPSLEEQLRLYEEEHPPMDLTGEEDEDWDANEDPIFRSTLRALPESTTTKGFKIPINGWVSPETQKYNVRLAEKLVDEEEATEQEAVAETPSKTPAVPSKIERMRKVLPRWAILNKDPNRTGTNFVDPNEYPEVPLSKFEMAQNSLFDSARATKIESATLTPSKMVVEKNPPTPRPESEIKQEEGGEPSTILASKLASFEISPAVQKKGGTLDKVESSSEPAKKEKTAHDDIEIAPQQQKKQEKDTKKEQIKKFKTPFKQIYSVPLHDDSVPNKAAPLTTEHTPKAKEFDAQCAARTTRAQKFKEALEAAKDLYKLDPLGPEWTKKVQAAAVSGNGDLKGYDIARAVPQYSQNRHQDNWLNDEVINAYLSLIAKHGRQGDREGQVASHHAFSSFFYSKLDKDGPEAVLRWSKRAKVGGKALLETEKLFIPINEGAHWKLCVVEAKGRKNITVYNSMGSARGRDVCKKVLAWIGKELGKEFDENAWTLDPAGYTAQQTNSDDCGVFTITTARQIMLGKMGTMEQGKTPNPYTADIIPIQRERIVAELINNGLLTSDESKK